MNVFRHGAPMKPSAPIELEPLAHYVLAYFIKYNNLNYKDRKSELRSQQ